MAVAISGCVTVLGEYSVPSANVSPEGPREELSDARVPEGVDAAASTTTRDAAPRPNDAASPTSDGGVGDGGACGRGPANRNVLRGAQVVVSSTYGGGYEGTRLNDGDLCTSWYAKTGACAPSQGIQYACAGTSITFQFSMPTLVRTAVLFGNRDGYQNSAYNVKSARLVARTTFGTEVSAAFEFSSNSNDAKASLSPQAMVTSLEIQILTADGSGPGLGEVEAYPD